MLEIEPTTEVAEELNPQTEEVQETVIENDIEDPSHNEGLTEDEKTEYSKGVQRRIDDLTKKRREAERDRDAHKKENDDAQKEITRLKNVHEQKRNELQSEPQKPEKTKIEDMKAQIKVLRAERAQAFEEWDGKKTSEIQDKIDELTEAYHSDRLKTQIETINAREESRALASFSKRNPWFSPNQRAGRDNPNYDSIKSNYAIAVENSLSDSGFPGSITELLSETSKQVNDFFKTKRPSLPNVAGASIMKKTKSVSQELTPQEAKVALAFGLTKEEYLEEKNGGK